MARVGPAASLLGLVAGGWNIFAYIIACHSSCLAQSSAPSDLLGGVYAGLSIVLIFASVGTLIGPKFVFYAMALVAVLVDLVEGLGYSNVVNDDLLTTFVLTTLCVALSFLAARSGTGVSEQSNPMNLPVFG